MNPHNAESTILLVDDNPANLTVLFEQLLAQGFPLMVAESGESALERVSYRKPEIILLDVRMPGIDGYETCRRLKADPETADIPVIFLSALTDTDDKIEGFQAGGVDFITKPMDFGEVLLRIRTQLTLARLQRDLAASNAEMEERVAARTAEMEAEVARRTQSEAEKSLLLDAVRTQSEHLHTLGKQIVAQQSQRRVDMSEELDQQVLQNISNLRDHLDALLRQEVTKEVGRHLKQMDQLLNHLLDATQHIAAHLQEVSPEERLFQANPLLNLSEREREVLLLMVNRHSTEEIARLLHITPSTVRTYRYRMLQKLDVTSDEDLLRYARQYKLIST